MSIDIPINADYHNFQPENTKFQFPKIISEKVIVGKRQVIPKR